MDNKKYFIYSQENDDSIVDFAKQQGVLVVSRDENEEETPLMVANRNLIELITAYKALGNLDFFDEKNAIAIIDKVIDIIETTDSINYSAFCVYFQVIGYSYNTYMVEKSNMTLDEKRELFKELIELYIRNRHNIYMYHGYSDQTLQVCSDAASSRRKGKIGIEMIEEILYMYGFEKAQNLNDLKGLSLTYILPDKGQITIFDDYLGELGVEFKFRKTHDAKNPDFLIKINNKIFIMEHKLTNGAGGSQNAGINEIIQFINYDEPVAKNVSYISCLAGDFFKKLNEMNTEPKTRAQFMNIIDNLSNHPHNYFVNGNGFALLISDLVKEK